MPIVTLEFELPEEKSEFDMALNGVNYYLAWCELQRHLRNVIKYEKVAPELREAYENIRSQMYTIETEHGIAEE